jgi:hypothetical protein
MAYRESLTQNCVILGFANLVRCAIEAGVLPDLHALFR